VTFYLLNLFHLCTCAFVICTNKYQLAYRIGDALKM